MPGGDSIYGDSSSSSSGTDYGKWISAALAAYGAYNNSKDQKARNTFNAQPQTTTSSITRSPFMSEQLQSVLPYIMQEAQRVYSDRMNFSHKTPGDFSPFAAALAHLGTGGSGTQSFGSAPSGSLPIGATGSSGFSTPSSSGDPGVRGSGDAMESTLNDFNARGNNLDMLTDQQKADSAFHPTPEQVKSFLEGAGGAVGGMAGGLANTVVPGAGLLIAGQGKKYGAEAGGAVADWLNKYLNSDAPTAGPWGTGDVVRGKNGYGFARNWASGADAGNSNPWANSGIGGGGGGLGNQGIWSLGELY